MNKLALSLVCIGVLALPNVSSAKDNDAIDYFDPHSSFEVVLKAPPLESNPKKLKVSDKKQSKRKNAGKSSLAANN